MDKELRVREAEAPGQGHIPTVGGQQVPRLSGPSRSAQWGEDSTKRSLPPPETCPFVGLSGSAWPSSSTEESRHGNKTQKILRDHLVQLFAHWVFPNKIV